jgi:hypothetical protein
MPAGVVIRQPCMIFRGPHHSTQREVNNYRVRQRTNFGLAWLGPSNGPSNGFAPIRIVKSKHHIKKGTMVIICTGVSLVTKCIRYASGT